MCNHWIALCDHCVPLLLNVSTNSHIGYGNYYENHNYCDSNDNNETNNGNHNEDSNYDDYNAVHNIFNDNNGDSMMKNEERHETKKYSDDSEVVSLDSNSNTRYIEYLRTRYSIASNCDSDNKDGPKMSQIHVNGDNGEIGISHIDTNDNNANTMNSININSTTFKSNNKTRASVYNNKVRDDNANSDISLLGLNRYVTFVIIPLLERQEVEKNKL